jgi:HEAT repeat protein
MNYFSPIISRTNLVTVLLAFLCFCGTLFAEPNSTDTNITGQLKINRWALLNSTDEQIRIDTAVEMLKSSAPETRRVLLEALSAKDNTAAQTSICAAVSRFSSFPQLIPDREDFIMPLMDILKVQNPEVAKLAAQASLVFTYRQVKNYLEDTAENSALPVAARKNAIYALAIRSDKEALSELIGLLDSDNGEIASAASDALQEWLPSGSDRQLWRKALKDLQGKSRTDILRERLLTQEQKARQLSDEVAKWQKRYITSLDIVYQATTDENARAKFIAENLAFDHSSVRLWAIEKINMWRKSGKSLPLEVFQKPLVALISDSDPQVRLATVKLLGALTNTASADALAAQLKVETRPDVKTEILIALAHVCNFALSPGAEVKINPQIRIQTLRVASEFLKDSNPVSAAEVIRNLLLQNGLEVSQVKPYFELIAGCFRKADVEQTKARLLEEMARLCGSDSFYRAVAGEVFGGIFRGAVDDSNNQISTPAVIGLIRIDQAGAFELFKQKGFTSHPSDRIRGELISAAGQIGTQDDLEWLGSIVTTAESQEQRTQAAEAMMNIFQHCKADIMLVWAQKFSQQSKVKNDEFLLARTRTLFEAAEKKAETEQDTKLLFSVRYSMAQHYADAGLYDLAAKYYGVLLQSSSDPNQISRLTTKLLDVDLRWGRTDSVKQLVANFLLSADISPDAEITGVLDDYFAANRDSRQAEQILLALASIKVSDQDPRPLWFKHLEDWKALIKITPSASVEPNVSAGPNTPAEPNVSAM